jgi:hypothetical protein
MWLILLLCVVQPTWGWVLQVSQSFTQEPNCPGGCSPILDSDLYPSPAWNHNVVWASFGDCGQECLPLAQRMAPVLYQGQMYYSPCARVLVLLCECADTATPSTSPTLSRPSVTPSRTPTTSQPSESPSKTPTVTAPPNLHSHLPPLSLHSRHLKPPPRARPRYHLHSDPPSLRRPASQVFNPVHNPLLYQLKIRVPVHLPWESCLPTK